MDTERWHDLNGLSYANGDELLAARAAPLDSKDRSPIARAIRRTFPKADPTYQGMIARRYRVLFDSIPDSEAVAAILAGYASPNLAMDAKVIPKRPYVGFREQRGPSE